MQFIQLEHLDRRQNTDFDILMDDIKKQAIEGNSNAENSSNCSNYVTHAIYYSERRKASFDDVTSE